jgi:hypothetical protein
MILPLFVVLIGIALMFIVIGYVKPDESAMALVGFLFLFLLSFVILNNQLEYEVGANVTQTSNTTTSINTNYAAYSGSNAHTMGYYMVVVSVVGFVGVLLGLRSAWKKESKRRGEE